MRHLYHRIAFELLEDRRQPGDLLFAAASLFDHPSTAAIAALPPSLADMPTPEFRFGTPDEMCSASSCTAPTHAKSEIDTVSHRKPVLELIPVPVAPLMGNSFTPAVPVHWTAAAPSSGMTFTATPGAASGVRPADSSSTMLTGSGVRPDSERSSPLSPSANESTTIRPSATKPATDPHYIVNGQTVALSQRTDRVALTLTDSTPATVTAVETATSLTRIRGIQGTTAVFEGPNASDYLTKPAANVLSAVPVFKNGSSDSVVLDQIIVALKGNADPAVVFADAVTYEPLAGTTDQYVVTIAGRGQAAIEAANSFNADPRVQWSEPNFYDDLRPQFMPTDTLLNDQWHLINTGQSSGLVDNDVDADLAWNLNPGGTPNRIISVVDDGLGLGHPDLNLWTNPGEIASNGLDDDGNGWVDDINGWNFITDNNISYANTVNDRHGTAVAGLAAGIGDNSLGVAGVSYKAQVMGVRIFDYINNISLANLASAVYYAAGRNRNGVGSFANVSVMNSSYGGGALSAAVQQAYSWATVHGRGDLGTVAVCATGNNGVGDAIYPARYSVSNTGLIGVGALTNQGARSSYSNYAGGLDVMAPSSGGSLGLVTTDRVGSDGYASGDYFTNFSGTSGATPIVSGTAALILSQADAKGVPLTATQVRSLLQNSTDLVAGATYRTDSGRSVEYGTGRINAFTAVDGVGKPEISVTSSTADLASGATLTLGNAIVGASTTTTLRIRNQGTSDLNLGTFSISGSSVFTVDSVSASVLKLGEAGTVTLRYAPTAVGANSGTLTLTSNDTDEGTFTLQLAGNGIAGSITGIAYEDRNGNGNRENGETGIAGRNVFLDANSNGSFDRFTQTATPNAAIPDNNSTGLASTIAVAGQTGAVSNISVTLNLTHTYVGDLVITLTGPTGAIQLTNRTGGTGQNFTSTVFNDAAGTDFGNALGPFTGTFRPITPLATFDGINPNGNWTLTVADVDSNDTGTFLNWALAFDTETKSVSDSQGLFGFGSLAGGTYSVATVTPSGWTATTPVQSVTLPSADTVSLGSARNNRVYGTVFDDQNSNSIQNPGESGVSGRTLFVDANSNGVLDTFTPIDLTQTVNTAIPDNSTLGISSTITVSGQTGTLADLDVTVTLRHNFVGDLRLTLVSPTNQSITLMNLRGGNGTNLIGTTFDTQANTAISAVNENQAPFRGPYRPENTLNALNGTSPNGAWRLIAADLGLDDTGTLESWGITFRTGTSETATITDALGQYSLDVPASATTLVLPAVTGFTFTTPASGTQSVTAAGAPAYGRNFGVIDAPLVVPPLIVNDGSAQRSRVSSVAVKFSETVQFTGPAANAFNVNGPVGSVAFTATVDNSNPFTLVTLTFAAPVAVDGVYTVTVNPALVSDLSANALVNPGPMTFRRIFGDLDGNGTVNGTDLIAFGNAFNTVTGQLTFRPEIDSDLDGVITGADLTEFGNRFGISF